MLLSILKSRTVEYIETQSLVVLVILDMSSIETMVLVCRLIPYKTALDTLTCNAMAARAHLPMTLMDIE